MVVAGRPIHRYERKDGSVYYEHLETIEECLIEHRHKITGAFLGWERRPGETRRLWCGIDHPSEELLPLLRLNIAEFEPDPPPPIIAELREFEKQGASALVAWAIANLKVEPNPPFPGRHWMGKKIWLERQVRTILNLGGQAEILECLRKHGSGNHGDYGRLEDIELTEEMRFCPLLHGPLARNKASFESDRGLVQSCYTARWREGRTDSIAVTTNLHDTTVIFVRH
jgi:hypothetical protein